MRVSGIAIGRSGAWATAAGILLLAGLLASCGRTPSELVVYSSRNEQLIKPMFDRYTAETGQAIEFVTDDAGPLIERLAAEGANSPADVLITVDAGDLWLAAQRGLLQPVESADARCEYPGSPARSRGSLVRRVGARTHDRLQHRASAAGRAQHVRGAR